MNCEKNKISIFLVFEKSCFNFVTRSRRIDFRLSFFANRFEIIRITVPRLSGLVNVNGNEIMSHHLVKVIFNDLFIVENAYHQKPPSLMISKGILLKGKFENSKSKKSIKLKLILSDCLTDQALNILRYRIKVQILNTSK